MASESDSAVLDMKDEGGSEMNEQSDDEVPPLIMEHGYDIAVKVDAPMKQLSRLETYVTYRVRCVCARWPSHSHVRRRYNHFKALYKRLVSSHPLLPVPPLPPLHTARQQLDRYSAGFVARRAIALDAFLGRVAKHPILTHSEDLRLFLTAAEGDLDKMKSDAGPLLLWGFGSNDAKTANGVRVKEPEFSSALDYLMSLQNKLTTLCTLTTKLYKDSNAVAKDYDGMRQAAETWSARESGAVSTATEAVAAAAGRVARCRGHCPGDTRPRALLPLLAAYSASVADKIKERDALHAAHLSATSSNDALHNRLEQASEALRSELVDWNAKTRTEIKQTLLEIADRQLSIHQQSLGAWEQALKVSAQIHPRDIFKTVSRSCVQNLSPTKSKSPVDTEGGLEDFALDSDNSQAQRVSKMEELKNFDLPSDLSRSSDDEPKDDVRHMSRSSDDEPKDDVRHMSRSSDDEPKDDVRHMSDPLSEFAEVNLSDI